MGRALEQAGFRTHSVINGSRAQMNAAINRFVEEVSGGGIGVFFFAGHGVQVANQNFLIPVDMQSIAREADIADQSVSLQSVQDNLAPNDPNPNGLFTREFLPWLNKPGVTLREAVLGVRSAVRARARSVNHEQFPAIYDQAEGGLLFQSSLGRFSDFGRSRARVWATGHGQQPNRPSRTQ